MKSFLPFHQLHNREAIIVDGAHASGLVLSHWKGQNTQEGIADDTSGAVVLNALRDPKYAAGLQLPFVTATHFDIDGFVGVWALFEPELALQYEVVLKAVARIGDFRETDFSREEDDLALKLVCWIDAEERNHFWVPFGEDHELKICAEKFEWFLPRFKDVLLHPDAYRAVWEADYLRTKNDYARIHGIETQVRRYDDLGLTVIRTPQPVSYYALFSVTHGSDIVLSIYDDNRYELEYKYTTWVDIVTRPTLPRLSMQPLCDELNAIETSGFHWNCDPVTDTGPILRLENSELSKAERFAHPTERSIFASSIAADELEKRVTGFFRKGYSGIAPKRAWTWAEVKSLQLLNPQS